jgi:hypothetical protein
VRSLAYASDLSLIVVRTLEQAHGRHLNLDARAYFRLRLSLGTRLGVLFGIVRLVGLGTLEEERVTVYGVRFTGKGVGVGLAGGLAGLVGQDGQGGFNHLDNLSLGDLDHVTPGDLDDLSLDHQFWLTLASLRLLIRIRLQLGFFLLGREEYRLGRDALGPDLYLEVGITIRIALDVQDLVFLHRGLLRSRARGNLLRWRLLCRPSRISLRWCWCSLGWWGDGGRG